MATIYLNEAATSLASPNWGGSGITNGDDLVINKPAGIVAAGLDQTGLAEGVQSLRILPTATAGRIGGGGAGPLRIDADNTGGGSVTPIVSNYGSNFELYIKAEGDNNLITNLDNGPGGSTWVQGGTVTNATVAGGRVEFNESTVVTNFYAHGGSGLIRANATAITLAEITGGNWLIERVVTTLRISGNATVTFDPAITASLSGTTLEVFGTSSSGPRVILKYGPFPTIKARGGTIDLSQARAAFTPGATLWTTFGTRYSPSTLVSTTNRAPIGGSQEVPDSPMPL
jgi:hypothetical protein